MLSELNKDLDNILESINKYFITDAGKPITGKLKDGGKLEIGRYGVWDTSGRKPQVIEVGNDLEFLKKKYNVKDVVKFADF